MDIQPTTTLFSDLSRVLDDARHLAVWHKAHPEATHVGVARVLQAGAPLADAYARMEPALRVQRLQQAGLFAPMPSVLRRVLGLPSKRCDMTGWQQAPHKMAAVQTLWAALVDDLHTLGTDPAQPSLAQLAQQMQWAEDIGDSAGGLSAAQHLFALKPFARSGGAMLAPAQVEAWLAAAFVAACKADAAPLLACHWGTKLFGRSAGALTQEHVRHAAALVIYQAGQEVVDGRAQARRDITGLLQLWAAMQAHIDHLDSAAQATLLDGASHGLRPMLGTASDTLERRYQSLARADAALPPLGRMGPFRAVAACPTLVDPAPSRFALAHYQPWPPFIRALMEDLEAAARGVWVPQRNCIISGPPGHGKSSLIEAFLAHAGALSRGAALHSPGGDALTPNVGRAPWPHPVRVARPAARDLLGSHFDESRQKIDRYFGQVHAEAQAQACIAIVCIEEVDVFLARWDGHQQEDNRVTRAFLAYTDNTQPYPNVFVVGTTNHADLLDEAVLSRFVVHTYTTPPQVQKHLLARLWDSWEMPTLLVFDRQAKTPNLLELTQGWAAAMPVRRLESLCARIQREQLAPHTQADDKDTVIRRAIMAFGRGVGTYAAPGVSVRRPAAQTGQALALDVPWRTLLRLRAAARTTGASPYATIYLHENASQITSVMLGEGGLHLAVYRINPFADGGTVRLACTLKPSPSDATGSPGKRISQGVALRRAPSSCLHLIFPFTLAELQVGWMGVRHEASLGIDVTFPDEVAEGDASDEDDIFSHFLAPTPPTL